MTQQTLIHCPGCETVVDVARPVCPGCGSCLNCGDRRAKKVTQCPQCNIPYCDCCGRCSGCLKLRYTEFGPCTCGHPNNEEQLQTLTQKFTIASEKQDQRLSEFFMVIVILAMIVVGVIGLILWLQ